MARIVNFSKPSVISQILPLRTNIIPLLILETSLSCQKESQHRERERGGRERALKNIMHTAKLKHRSSGTESTASRSSSTPGWITESINGGSLRHVDLHSGVNGWASPPGDLFSLRSRNYFTKN